MVDAPRSDNSDPRPLCWIEKDNNESIEPPPSIIIFTLSSFACFRPFFTFFHSKCRQPVVEIGVESSSLLTRNFTKGGITASYHTSDSATAPSHHHGYRSRSDRYLCLRCSVCIGAACFRLYRHMDLRRIRQCHISNIFQHWRKRASHSALYIQALNGILLN